MTNLHDKQWVKVVKMNGRTFKLIFGRDTWNFLWCWGYEIYRPKKHFFDFSYKSEVFKFWTPDEETIIEQALAKIDDLFKEEEKTKKVEKALDKFADYIV
jgi:hypothetical protein